MRLQQIIIIATLIITAACSNKSEKKVIPRDDFTEILVDVHLMDGLTSFSEYRKGMAQTDSIEYLEAVLKHHGYNKTQYDSSLVYYSKDLRRFDRIYQDVIERLNQMETKANEEVKEERELREQQDSSSAHQEKND
ncbi:MAG: DUF4296 domain-containing protein [Bacteroidales bacterium]